MKNKINKFIHSKYLLISLIVLLVLLVIATGTYAWFTWRISKGPWLVSK